MGRRKKAELERAVIDAARRVRFDRALIANSAHTPPQEEFDAYNRTLDELEATLDALDDYLEEDLSGAGQYVEGSPETSRNAALEMLGPGPSKRRAILDQIAASDRGPDEARGLTDYQLEGRLKMLHQTESAARKALVDKGWIMDSGHRRTNPVSQDPCVVWVLTPAARRHFLARALEDHVAAAR